MSAGRRIRLVGRVMGGSPGPFGALTGPVGPCRLDRRGDRSAPGVISMHLASGPAAIADTPAGGTPQLDLR